MADYKCVSENYPDNSFTLIKSMKAETIAYENTWCLPLPSTMPYTDEFEWSSEDVATALGNTVSDFVGRAEGLGGKIGNIASKFKMVLNGGKAAMGSGNILASLAGYGMGKAYNPNKMLFFTGAPHRNFSMSFDLVAESEIQAINMAQGVQALRIDASPGYNTMQLFFEYPKFFYIAVFSHGKCVIKRPVCAIKTINSNLSSGGGVTAFHSGGKPVSYTLEIQGIDAIIETAATEQERDWLGESGKPETFFSQGQTWWRNALDLF